MEVFIGSIIYVFLGLITALLAHYRGRSFILWWLYSSIFVGSALIHVMFINDDNDANDAEQNKLSAGYVKCPYCADMIKAEAIRCKHCGSDLTEIESEESPKVRPLIPKELIIPTKNGTIIDSEGIRKLVEYYVYTKPESTDLYTDFQRDILSIKNILPAEIHETYIRKAKFWCKELSKKSIKNI